MVKKSVVLSLISYIFAAQLVHNPYRWLTPLNITTVKALRTSTLLAYMTIVVGTLVLAALVIFTLVMFSAQFV